MSRIKPQIEMDKTDYTKFRAACGNVPARWVIEELLKLTLSDSISGVTAFKLALSRAKIDMDTGKKHRHGRPAGRRDSTKREPRRSKSVGVKP